jgi:hypothetical protein
MTIWHMRIACWIPKATNTHSENVTHCFSATTVVARTPLTVTLYAHCLSCYTVVWPASCLLNGLISFNATDPRLVRAVLKFRPMPSYPGAWSIAVVKALRY